MGFGFVLFCAKWQTCRKATEKKCFAEHFRPKYVQCVRQKSDRSKEKSEHIACINIDTRKCCGEFCHRMEYWRFVMLFQYFFLLWCVFDSLLFLRALLCFGEICLCVTSSTVFVYIDVDMFGLIAVSKGTHFVDVESWLFWTKNIMCVHVSGVSGSTKPKSIFRIFINVQWEIAIFDEKSIALCVCVKLCTILHHAMPSPLQKTKFSMFFRLCFIFFFSGVAFLLPCIWCIS